MGWLEVKYEALNLLQNIEHKNLLRLYLKSSN